MYIVLWEQFTGKPIDAFSSGKCQLPLTFHFLSFPSKSKVGVSVHTKTLESSKKGIDRQAERNTARNNRMQF